ncbi:MAG: GH3 auxin-responsive promoter family protein [Deltaproteobacteria bacterium]|nr:GH3 auxin-responsive promoter family protein [Deltaproteobacteria bacterium]
MAIHPLLLHAFDAAYLLIQSRALRRFQAATHDVLGTQARLLARLVDRNRDTAYGRAHAFARIRSVADFQARVPVVAHRDLVPWIERAAAGEANVLTRSAVLLFEPTSGTTEQPKLIPFTRDLLAEIQNATGAWLCDLYRARPQLRGTRSYWSISPALRAVRRTAGGARIGFADDTEYLGPLASWLWRQKLAVPPAVARCADIEGWRHQTLRHLLLADDLGMISVWSPTFLSLLMTTLERRFEAVLADLPPGRAAELRRRVDAAGALTAAALWPRLGLISCWTAASARLFVADLGRWFAGVEIQGKGLMATEGIVSFPLSAENRGPVAAIRSHFLEFQPVSGSRERPRLAHELEAGERYVPLLSTGGGLYRYALGDVVACVGHHHQAPLLQFEGKRDLTSDLAGEKLDATAVSAALEHASQTLGAPLRFALVAPALESTPGYRLYVDCDADDAALDRFVGAVEASLCGNFHYRYCRDLGQLAALRVRRVTDGWARFEAAQARRGAVLGGLKPLGLDSRPDWAEVFGA